MKKMFTYMAMIVMTMTVFTSCTLLDDSDDRHEARTLSGTWTGYIDTYYYDRWGLTGDSYRTTMYFERENAYGGWGYEVDYDLNNRYDDSYYCEFTWEVAGGRIRIRYADSWDDVYISDYRLSSTRFEGYMDDGTSRDIYFQLTYDGRFDWSYWHTRAVTRSTGADSTARVMASGVFASGNDK